MRPSRAAPFTPNAAEGPFYPLPEMRRADVDNDLVTIAGRVVEAGGEIITLKGRITDPDGAPLAGLRIEIWQCDMNGHYLHPGDPRHGDHDPGFQGVGHDITDENGRYRFRTIKPRAYPGRTPHIHVMVLEGADEILTTQLYIRDDIRNRHDVLYQRMTPSEARLVSMVFTEGPNGSETEVDFVV